MGALFLGCEGDISPQSRSIPDGILINRAFRVVNAEFLVDMDKNC
jgi:hypothetical protein